MSATDGGLSLQGGLEWIGCGGGLSFQGWSMGVWGEWLGMDPVEMSSPG